MSRLSEIAEQLGQLYQTKNSTALIQWQAKQDLEGRMLFLVPKDGWEGKNQEQRDLARDRMFTADETILAINKQADDAYRALSVIEGLIAALEAERRALEWQIRDRLIDALQARRVQVSGPVAETAFDDAADQVLDGQAFEQPDELPF